MNEPILVCNCGNIEISGRLASSAEAPVAHTHAIGDVKISRGSIKVRDRKISYTQVITGQKYHLFCSKCKSTFRVNLGKEPSVTPAPSLALPFGRRMSMPHPLESMAVSVPMGLKKYLKISRPPQGSPFALMQSATFTQAISQTFDALEEVDDQEMDLMFQNNQPDYVIGSFNPNYMLELA